MDDVRRWPRRTGCQLASRLLVVLLVVYTFTSPTGALSFPRLQSILPGDDARSLEGAEALSYLPSKTPSTRQSAGQTPIEDEAENYGSHVLELGKALETMQLHFFELWQGTWTKAIDWTAAVMGTYVSSTLHTASTAMAARHAANPKASKLLPENFIDKYFSQLQSFYFGEDAFSLRTQAYDDMLWVVLDWLEAIKFIRAHSKFMKASISLREIDDPPASDAWYGEQWIPSFSHRARIFYDLAARGWDTSLCGGGMIWNPYLTPYKNAITNELYISASVSMYLYFPGDDIESPFDIEGFDGFEETGDHYPGGPRIPPAKPHNKKHLLAAIEGYNWLRNSNMTNSQGLYTDGFHVRPRLGKSPVCDVRNEMVYTYNQGVLLSGLRGLWDATGKSMYLQDGHALIRSVINATGWHGSLNSAAQNNRTGWHGIGRDGILEEACDAQGDCSQDGQTFKGIFFHHLTLFCEPMASTNDLPAWEAPDDLSEDTWAMHEHRCESYAAWIAHNAHAALSTKDRDGVFGMWWGAKNHHPPRPSKEEKRYKIPEGAVDYRNLGIPKEWRSSEQDCQGFEARAIALAGPIVDTDHSGRDPNRRGRGRTVETHGGGMSVLRALWEFVDRPKLGKV